MSNRALMPWQISTVHLHHLTFKISGQKNKCLNVQIKHYCRYMLRKPYSLDLVELDLVILKVGACNRKCLDMNGHDVVSL